MLTPQHATKTGFGIADCEDSTIDQSIRGSIMPVFVTLAGESEVGREDWRVKRPGDLPNMTWWPLDFSGGPSRGAVTGSYSAVFPAKKGGGLYRPMRSSGTDDQDYKQQAAAAANGANIPDGAETLIVSTVGHYSREKMAFWFGGNGAPLIAQHRGNSLHAYSSMVSDIDGDSLSQQVRAGLHGVFKVRGKASSRLPGALSQDQTCLYAPPPNPPADIGGGYGLWINATASANDPMTGNIPLSFDAKDAYASWEMHGPLAWCTDKHLLNTSFEGRQMTSAGLSMEAYWTDGKDYDGPKEFTRKPYIPPARGPYPHVVEQRWDGCEPHSFVGGTKRPGMWKREAWIPVTATPTCEKEPKDPATGDPKYDKPKGQSALTHFGFIGPSIKFMPMAGILAGRPVQPPLYRRP